MHGTRERERERERERGRERPPLTPCKVQHTHSTVRQDSTRSTLSNEDNTLGLASKRGQIGVIQCLPGYKPLTYCLHDDGHV